MYDVIKVVNWKMGGGVHLERKGQTGRVKKVKLRQREDKEAR